MPASHPTSSILRCAVFLDRDGVINKAIIRDQKPYPPSSLEELEIIAGVPEALQLLREAGFLLICITNQPDVARGIQKREVVEKINTFLIKSLRLDEILVCYHDDSDNCYCRKPKPGLLYHAAEKYSIHLPSSFMIGDRWKDIEAGRRAGCITILVDCNYSEPKSMLSPHCRVPSLKEAANWICDKIKGGKIEANFSTQG